MLKERVTLGPRFALVIVSFLLFTLVIFTWLEERTWAWWLENTQRDTRSRKVWDGMTKEEKNRVAGEIIQFVEDIAQNTSSVFMRLQGENLSTDDPVDYSVERTRKERHECRSGANMSSSWGWRHGWESNSVWSWEPALQSLKRRRRICNCKRAVL
ncbi:hypothetical protein QBC46DRAFT_404814 [Diplogelasinospora grovesii]|uniref:Uncharacterized protein n=1 Tax=Diplogelasinospora grovesii TaxID=303347 RepID=A0AAN6NEC5_9PEZI|nr:hypothetical protein QBC46DRAFT_404814 [Diplogelasinospora grovesii]